MIYLVFASTAYYDKDYLRNIDDFVFFKKV